jgi:hypothetical protein
VRVEALARRPVDGVRRVADPVLFLLATQLVTHAIWKEFGLPEAGSRVVLEAAFFSFALSRLGSIGRLARLYAAPCGRSALQLRRFESGHERVDNRQCGQVG